MQHDSLHTNEWLKERLKHVWKKYFSDIPQVNEVIIRFGRSGKNQLGSITAKGPRRRFRRPGRFPKESYWLPDCVSAITINGRFRSHDVPEVIVDSVIAHELVHYSHGFCSPHPQLFRYPHQGSVVTKELKDRGLGEELKLQKKWLKTTWRSKN